MLFIWRLLACMPHDAIDSWNQNITQQMLNTDNVKFMYFVRCFLHILRCVLLPHSGWLIFTELLKQKASHQRYSNRKYIVGTINIKTERALLFNKVAPHFNQMASDETQVEKNIQSFLYHFSFCFFVGYVEWAIGETTVVASKIHQLFLGIG